MKLRYYDYLVVVSVVLFWVAHATTSAIVSYDTKDIDIEETVEAYVELTEANPVTAWAIKVKMLHLVMSVLMLPAFLGGTYVVVRRWGKEPWVGEQVAWVIVLVAFTDALNDVSILLGRIAAG